MSKSKKFFALILSILVLFLLGSSVAFAAYYDDNTGDNWNDAYIITSVEDLKLMRDRINNGSDNVGKYYKLDVDIDLSTETEWEPIGNTNYFTGCFDGQNHTITLNINKPGATNVGLFDTMNSESAIIRNLNITGTLKGEWIGAFVWCIFSGKIENCNFSGTLDAGTWAACFVDLMYGGTISNCSFNGTVTSNTTSAGGIVAEMYDGNVNNCETSAAASINCPEYAGGIVGLMHGGYLSNSNTQAHLVLNEANYRGGIVGGATANVRANVSGNSWPSSYQEIGGEIASYSNETINTRLHVAIVEPISEEYQTEDLLQKLADNVSTDRSNIQWLPADAIDTSEPPEPTQSMRDQVAKDSYQFAAKLNAIKVSEDGYYAFQVTVSDDLVGMNVSNLKLYYADEDEFSGSSASLAFFGLMPAINGITGSLEVSNMLGVKLDTLPKQFLATMFLSASKSMTVYIVKILLALLGGCNVGFGIAGGLIASIVAVKFFKKRK